MMEIPIWFYWYIVIGSMVILLFFILKFFIHKYTKGDTQNYTQNNKPTIMKPSVKNTTDRNGGNKTNQYTPIIMFTVWIRHIAHIIGDSKSENNHKRT